MGRVKKTIYSTSYIATYLFETTNYDGTFTRWRTQVEVLGETDLGNALVKFEVNSGDRFDEVPVYIELEWDLSDDDK